MADDRAQSLMDHLTELRRRIIYAIIAVVVCVGGALVFAHDLFKLIMSTALAHSDVKLVQGTFGETFMTEFRLAIIMGLVVAFPVILYQLVAFILPALMPNEKRLLYAGLPFATVLFAGGWAFGWFVVVPITRDFFLGVALDASIENLISPRAYIDFVLGICNPLGIAFELPLLVMILARIGLVSGSFLGKIRRYAYFGLLVLAAVLSPPDIISMCIFMVPLVALYEFSVLLAKLVGRKREW